MKPPRLDCKAGGGGGMSKKGHAPIVDGESRIQEILKSALEGAGFECAAAAGAETQLDRRAAPVFADLCGGIPQTIDNSPIRLP